MRKRAATDGEPETNTAEQQIAEALWAIAQSDAIEGNFVLVESLEEPQYSIQFRAIAGVIRGEAVHNSCLAPEQQLTEAQCAELVRLGWHEPKTIPGSYFRGFVPEGIGDCLDAASVVFWSFTGGYGVGPGGSLRITLPKQGLSVRRARRR